MADITRTKADARPTNDYQSIEIVMDVAVEAGQWVYVKSNGKGAIADASAAGTALVAGIATMDCPAGRAVALVTLGKFGGFDGMTPGTFVYLSDTVGETADGVGTVTCIVGWAVSATDIMVSIRGSAVGAGSIGAAEIAPDAVTASELANNAVDAAAIAAAAVTKTKLAGGFLKVALAAGTASGTDVTVAAIAVGDELVSVLSFATAAAIATVADRTAEYAIQAGGLDKTAGTNETSNQLVIIYLDLT